MTNHPNRANPAFRTIRGTTMDAGYCTERSTRLRVFRASNGDIFAFDLEDGMGDGRDPRLVLDVDGQITRDGAAAGYGFMPDDGEIERLAAVGYSFPAQQ